MTARFRCPECKQALCSSQGGDPQKGGVMKCPECGSRFVVPPAIAGLPHPQIEDQGGTHADEFYCDDIHHAEVLSVMARCMPWLMSIFLHAAMAMIFMFVAMIIVVEQEEIQPHEMRINNISPYKTTFISPTPPKTFPGRPDTPTQTPPKGLPESGANDPSTDMSDDNSIIGLAANLSGLNSGKSLGPLGIPDGRGIFIGGPVPSKGPGPDVVFLLDRSGSMVDSFDVVRQELLRSVKYINDDRRFHVVLFSDGKPLENTPRRMTLATKKAKVALVDFIQTVRASGRTDPIPAINRAFDAITRGSQGRNVVIHLLTDGVFPDNQAVLSVIRSRNVKLQIPIYTILYGNRPPAAEKVLAEIARETKGSYRFISRDE
ncbi:MAG: VWA domain-containing protein [Phycisphaerales bacterium]|jgi:DNA-directed RNA polymerase subunit RPC12/RpoP|nr:VWA domain-containing protein [Phycisphaerales bacterium]